MVLAPKKHISSSPEKAEVIKWGRFPRGSRGAFITLSDSLSQHNIKRKKRERGRERCLSFRGRPAVIELERLCKSGRCIWPPASSPLYSILWNTPQAVNTHVHVNQRCCRIPISPQLPDKEQSNCSDSTDSHSKRCCQETGWKNIKLSKQHQMIQCEEPKSNKFTRVATS